ncbi:MAG: F0F1 ATP synthase subunit B [Candidatus Pelethousia sp.]|nr:F0F1 ATP synthase subunit B [Candidatus Pelethousia sp.]
MQLNVSDIILHLVNIVVLYLLLRLLIYKPVRKFMDNRAARVQAQMDEATRINEEAHQKQAEYEQRLAAMEEEASNKMQEANRAASEAAAAITAQAQEEAKTILEQAQTEADQQRETIQRQVRPQIVDISVDIAEKLLGREVSREDNRALIDSFFQSQEKVG